MSIQNGNLTDGLDALSPLDGRYARYTRPLREFFSERALIGYRIEVESRYLLHLFMNERLPLRELTVSEIDFMESLYKPTLEEARIVKAIETTGFENFARTNHDVKAVELYMRYKFSQTSLADTVEWIHFALTSEDINNIAYGFMLQDAISKVVLPALSELCSTFALWATKYKDLPMLARTHNQPATPTTLGKEFRVFASRLSRQIALLKKFELLVKLNGATGNWSAHQIAFKRIDWRWFSETFIASLNNRGARHIKLMPNFETTQVESHDTYSELFAIFTQINTILTDFVQDMWSYIGDEWIVQQPVPGEVGSSTMPQKINPIDIESAEGNLQVANALLNMFRGVLPISRRQRHLSDSTIIRNFGSAFGYCLIAYKGITKGMTKYSPNPEQMIADLGKHPEVISEAYQTILRREGVAMPYDRLKELTRGKKVTLLELHAFVDSLDVPDQIKEELKAITPLNYLGLAPDIAQS